MVLFRKLLYMLVIISLVTVGSAFARGNGEQQTQTEESTEQSQQEGDTIRVASNVQIPLRIFYEGDQIRGYEYEIYREALNRAGYQVEVVDVDFSGILPGLSAEQWRMAASNIFITEERAAQFSYSEPYLESFDAVIVRESDDSIDELSDLEGKVIGTETGTTQAAYASQLQEQYGPFEEIRGYDDTETQMLDLENGRIDALTLGQATAAVYIQERGMFEVLGTSQDNFMIGAFFREGDPLRDEFTQALQSMKEDGTTAELFEQYFGDPPAEGSAPVRVFEEPYTP
jgi:ABC-type amino acid transport substrate-binding protein